MRIRERKQIHQTLLDNVRSLKQPGWYFLDDTNLGDPADFDTAKLRILLLFLSAGETRSVSSTDLVLTSIIKQTMGDDVFVDVCFLPIAHNAEVFDKLNLPWSFGGLSHHHALDFDVIVVSNAIIDEKINLLPMFDRSDIPLWFDEREEGGYPLVLMGGAGSSEGEPLYGKSADGKHEGLIDCTYVGYAEPHFPRLLKVLLEKHLKESLIDWNKRELTLELVKDFDCIYAPWGYEHVYEADNWTIKEIKKLVPELPDRVQFAQVLQEHADTVAGFENKLLYGEGNFDSNDIQISFGCSGGYVCSFCHEGSTQAWREKPLEKIRAEMRAARNKSFGSCISFYSFNTNFHTQYEDMMNIAASMYPKVSAIAMRADEIAARPDYFRMNKYLGLSRITLGVEGVSDRIRNGVLHKALSEEAVLAACKPCFDNRFMQVKLFFILSGREEEKDWQEGVELINKIVKLRDQSGSNTHLRVSFSILCHYPNTGAAWEERLAVKHTLKKGRIRFFIDECMRVGVGVRFSSRGLSTTFQQYNIDIGRPMTAIYEKLYREKDFVWYRNVPDGVVDRMLEICAEMGIPDFEEVLKQRPYDWIFPSQVVRVKDEKFMIKQAQAIEAMEPKTYCMPTQSKLEDSGCDVCGLCPDKESIKQTAYREVDRSKVSVDDVILAVSLNKPVHRYRFEFNVPPESAFMVKRPLATYYLTQAIPEEFKDHVYSVGADSDPGRWTNCVEVPYSFHGKYFFDLLTRKPLPDLGEAPKNTRLQMVQWRELPLKRNALKPTDRILSVLSVKPNDRIYQALREGLPKFPYLSNDFPLEWTKENGVVPVSLVKGEVDKLVVVHPIRSNLVKWLCDMTKGHYTKVYADMFVALEHVVYMRPVEGFTCRLCNNAGYINLATGKQTTLCPDHTQSLVLNSLSKVEESVG